MKGLDSWIFSLSEGVKKKITMAVRTNRTEYKAGTKRHPPGIIPPRYEPPTVLAMTAGPMNFVADAPTFPAPNTPSANPCRSRGNQ